MIPCMQKFSRTGVSAPWGSLVHLTTAHTEAPQNVDIEIGVHIADVTYFVEHDSALDIEAQKRGTTFYLVDRRFDMLPSVLSSNLCSLHGGVDRLAVSVIWVMIHDFSSVKSTWFGRTVIRNCAGKHELCVELVTEK